MGTPKLALIAALAMSAVAPAAAQAATVSQPQTGTYTSDLGGHNGRFDIPVYTLKFEAYPGEANDVTLERDPDPSRFQAVIVRDAGAALDPGVNCERVSGGVECSPQLGTLTDPAVIELGDGDDRILVGPGLSDLAVFGGAGADDLRADGAGVTLSGGSGPDRIEGLGGDAVVASYAGRATGVDVSLDGTANDGEAGEGDDVEGTVVVIGGSGPDVLTGPPGPDALGVRLASGAGDDVITGGSGSDHLDGGSGRDMVVGNDGDDQVVVDKDPDAVDAGEGRDRLVVATAWPTRISLDPARGDATFTHASGVEVLQGGAGPDVVIGSESAEAIDETSGGRDLIYAGGGDDRITTSGFPGSYVDAGSGKDIVSLSGFGDQAELRDEEQDDLRCSRPARRTVVDRDPFDTGACSPFAFFPRAGRLRVSRRGAMAIPLACPLTELCTGAVELGWRGHPIATPSFRRKPYSKSHIRVELPLSARKKLRAGRSLRMTLALEVRLHVEPAATHSVTRRITVLPARRR
jgi:hypothetical protein